MERGREVETERKIQKVEKEGGQKNGGREGWGRGGARERFMQPGDMGDRESWMFSAGKWKDKEVKKKQKDKTEKKKIEKVKK